MKNQIEAAICLRKENRGQEALEISKKLLDETPENPQLLYQLAWTCDSLGYEDKAIPSYEKALICSLNGIDRRGAYLGLFRGTRFYRFF